MKATAIAIAMAAAGVLLMVGIVRAIALFMPSTYDGDDEVHP